MKKILLLNLLFFTISNFSFSQSEIIHREKVTQISTPKCGFNSAHKELENSNPEYKIKTEEFNNYLRSGSYQVKAGTIYQIPVVVHVMETGNSLTDITDSQIKDAIRGMNEMLRKQVGTPGDGNGVDVEIEYVLAVRDPSDNCTNGINRFDMTGNATYMASGVSRGGAGITDASLKATISWDKNKYYNIWIISEIDNNNGGSGTQGYAFFASSHGSASDGAVILSNSFKNPYSSTAVHEIGHSLNLFHTFEGDDLNGDDVVDTCPTGNSCGSDLGDCCADTPPHVRSSSDCVVGANGCDGGSSTDLFIHNYMDYSNDACQNELTADQKIRMQAAVTVTRASYLASNGNDALIPVAIAGVDFSAGSSILCGVGQTVQFYDFSSCVPNTYLSSSAFAGITFNWSITNGINTYTSTDQNPSIIFADLGSFDVTLSVTNAFGTDVLTKADFIVVSSTPTVACIPNSDNESNFAQTVNNVTFNTINNSTSSIDNVAYTDFSCSKNTVVEEGQTYSMSITVRAGGSSAEDFEAYIDYNNDGDFADAGEQVLIGSTPINSTNTITGNVTIPVTATLNTLLRMRVIGETFGITASDRNCSTNFFIGDVEDYGVLITSACVAPSIIADPSNSSICENDNTTFTASASGDATLNFQWMEDAGGGFVNITDGGVYSGATTGTLTLTGATASMNNFVYKCEVTNSCGTATSNSATLTIANIIIAQGTTSNPTSCGASDGSIEITGVGTGDLSYTGTASGTDFAVTLPFTTSTFTAGTYDFTFNDGCPSNTVSVTISDPGAPADPTITPSGATTFCDGGSVMLTSSSAVDNVWSTGETTQSIVVTTSNTYSVFVSTAGCNSGTVSEVVTVDPLPATPTITASGATSFCMGGSVDLTSSSAINNTWSTGETTQTITVFAGGNYNVTVSNGACTATSLDEVVTVISGAVIAQGATSNPSVCGVADGSIEITGVGTGDLSYTGTASGTDFAVTLPFTTNTFTAGTYDFTFNDGCPSNTVSVTISDPGAPADPIITPSGATTFCDGGSVMFISSSAVDNVWSTGETTQSIVVTTSNTYSVFVSTAGCNSGTVSEVVTVDPLPATPTITASGVTTFCMGGSVDLTSSSAINNTWSTGETTQTITVSAGGNYNVTVSNGACTATSLDEVVTVISGAVIAQGATSNPSACLASDGSIEITGVGTGDLSFTGTASGTDFAVTLPFTTSTFTAGTYDFTFNDGCPSNTVSVTISDPGAPADPIITPSGATTFCDGGSVMLTSSSAVDNVWSTGETTQSIVVTTSNTYSVFVSTAGCNSGTVSEVVTVDPLPATPTITASGVTTFCMGGSVDLTSSSAINNTWSTGETTQTITVFAGGNYNVTVSNGACTATSLDEVVTVISGAVIAQGATNSPSVCGAADGSIEITGVGTGDLSYTGTASGTDFAITLPFTTSTFTAGTYDFTFNDGCPSNTVSVTISDPGAPATPTITPSGATTFCDGGSVMLTSSSAVDNVWSTGETTQSIVVTTSNTYSVFVSTAGCNSGTVSEVVTVDPLPATPTITASGATSFCTGGSVDLTSSSAINNTWSTGETTQTITVFAGGNYNVTVSNGACTATSLDEVVTVISGAVIAQGATNSPSVCGAADGSIEITGVGTGDLSYTGTASGTDFAITLPFTTSTFTAGTYDFTFNDGCPSNTVSVTISDPGAPATPTITPSGATTFCDGGSVMLTSSSAVDNVWSTGETTQSIVVTISNTYSVFVSTAGCNSLLTSEVVTVNPIATISQGTTSDPTVCGASDGSIEITGIGTGDLSYTGTASGTDIGVTLPFTTSFFAAGTYDFTFNDGCNSNTVTISLTDPGAPAAPSISAGGPTTFCDGGSVTLTSSSAIDNVWSTGETTQSIVVTTTNAISLFLNVGGCSSPSTFENITVNPIPATPVITASGATTFCDGGSVTLTSSSASNNTWSTGETTQSIMVTTSNTYSLIVDNGTCTAQSLDELVTVNPVQVIASGIVSDPTLCGVSDGQIEILGSSTGDLTYVGALNNTDFGITLPFTVTNLPEGTYDFTFDDGCVSNTISVSLVAPLPPSVPVISADGPLNFCIGDDVVLSSSSTGNNTWSTGETTDFITVNSSGTYNVTATSGSCSTTSANVIVNVNSTPTPTPTITASDDTTFCTGGNVILTSSSAGNNTWSTGQTTQSITVNSSNNYSVSVNIGGCVATSIPMTVTVNPIPSTPIISANGPTTLCSGSTLILTSSATANNTWSTGQTTQNINVTSSGSYNVTVTELGCSATSTSVAVTVNQTPQTPLITANGSYTFCEGGSVDLSTTASSNFTWSTGETTQTITVNSTAIIFVSVTVNGCTSTSTNVNVTENLNPVVTLAPFNDVCNTSGIFALTNGIPSGGNYMVNGVPTTTFNPATAFLGPNVIDYTLTDGNGCTGTTTGNINVLNCLNVEELSDFSLTIYPNPTEGLVHLKGENLDLISSIELRDELGRLIAVYSELTETIDLSAYANGIYTLFVKGYNIEQIHKIQLVK